MTIYFGDGTSQASAGITTGGKVLQVTAGTKTSAASYNTSGNWTDIGLSESITPSSSSHKILIRWYIGKVASNDWSGATRLLRGSTVIGAGDADGNRTPIGTSFSRAVNDDHWDGTSMVWLDSPSTTSSTTYKIQVNSTSNATIYVNRGHSDGNDADVYAGRSASAIILSEID
tara:strand:+ start:32 stop:550 length:519 start_codon:yes stop_codon:yes gene_type:complete